MDLPRIEPVHVKEESPAHRRWPRPYQPRRAEHDEDAGDLAQEVYGPDEEVRWRLRRRHDHLPRRRRIRREEIERDRLPRQQIFDTAEHGDAVPAVFERAEPAAHGFKIEPVACGIWQGERWRRWGRRSKRGARWEKKPRSRRAQRRKRDRRSIAFSASRARG